MKTKAISVPELNGNPKLFTNKSSVALKNFKVFGSNNLKMPIRIAIPMALAIIKPIIGFSFNDFKISS